MRWQFKWGPAFVCFGVTLVFSLLFYYRAPYHDHWSIVPLYGQMQDGTLSFSDVFMLHGRHWHASGYLIQLGLSKLTGMGHWAESLASVLIAGVGFVALVRILGWAEMPGAMAWLIGVSAFFLFSLDQAGNWLWGWQVAVFLNLAGVLWAIERLSCGAPTLANTGLAAFAAAVAIYAFATGWALIPIGWALLLVFGGLQSRRGLACLALWTLFAGAIGFHFVVSEGPVAAPSVQADLPPLLDFATLQGLAHYSLNFMASPIVRFARDISVPIAILGAGILIVSVRALRLQDRHTIWTRTAPLLALAAYAVGAALLTALGRWEMYGVKQAFVSRYISFGNLFWIAVFALAILVIARLRDRSHRVLIGLLGLLFVLKIANQPSVIQKTVRLSKSIEASAETLAATYPNTPPEDYAILHNPLQTIERDLSTLQTHRVSLFADGPRPDPAPDEAEAAN